uniref:Uncharacterized protein n=1 Tax=Opuntia streptacantha TaxID=393608 RepID=A0A7C9CJL1_OPUST
MLIPISGIYRFTRVTKNEKVLFSFPPGHRCIILFHLFIYGLSRGTTGRRCALLHPIFFISFLVTCIIIIIVLLFLILNLLCLGIHGGNNFLNFSFLLDHRHRSRNFPKNFGGFCRWCEERESEIEREG